MNQTKDASYLLIDLHTRLAEQHFHHVWNIHTRKGMELKYRQLDGGVC